MVPPTEVVAGLAEVAPSETPQMNPHTNSSPWQHLAQTSSTRVEAAYPVHFPENWQPIAWTQCVLQ